MMGRGTHHWPAVCVVEISVGVEPSATLAQQGAKCVHGGVKRPKSLRGSCKCAGGNDACAQQQGGKRVLIAMRGRKWRRCPPSLGRLGGCGDARPAVCAERDGQQRAAATRACHDAPWRDPSEAALPGRSSAGCKKGEGDAGRCGEGAGERGSGARPAGAWQRWADGFGRRRRHGAATASMQAGSGEESAREDGHQQGGGGREPPLCSIK